MEKTVEELEVERIEEERVEEAKFEKRVTSETDKRMTSAMQKRDTEYKEKLAEADRKSKLTADETQKERDKEHEEWETEKATYKLNQNKHELFKKEKYDSRLEKFAFGNNIDEINANAKELMEIVKEVATADVNERMKTNSYTPPKGGNASGEKNPWAKETFNLTEQGKMLKNNPTLATSYMNKK